MTLVYPIGGRATLSSARRGEVREVLTRVVESWPGALRTAAPYPCAVWHEDRFSIPSCVPGTLNSELRTLNLEQNS